MSLKALEGVKVLEYCSTLSGPYLGKLMADLGAEVVHIEAPGVGDDARKSPPFPGDTPHPEKSGLFLFVNTNKLGITLDPEPPEGRELFKRLVAEADVLIDDWPPGHMEKIGLGYDDLSALNPGLVIASITPYGLSGPYKDYKAYPLNVSHVSGQGNVLPLPSPHLERAPVRIGGHCTDYDPGQSAAVAVLAALYSKEITGKGQIVEVSSQEAVLAYQQVEVVVFPNGGQVLTRKGPDTDRAITMKFECKDGYVILVMPLEHQKESFMKLLGYDGLAEGKTAADLERSPEDAAALREFAVGWMKERTKQEVCSAAQALSCPISTMSSSEDVIESAQIKSRGFVAEVEHPVAGKLQMPAVPYHFSETPVCIEHAAPLLGEHNDEVYRRRLGCNDTELEELTRAGII